MLCRFEDFLFKCNCAFERIAGDLKLITFAAVEIVMSKMKELKTFKTIDLFFNR